MANKNLFNTKLNSVKNSDTLNNAGGKAYSLSDKNALAQIAVTGCFNGTFYTSEKDLLDQALVLAQNCPVEFVAKTALYARENGYMKDMPAFLAAIVASKDVKLLEKIFDRTIDDPKMLRNFVQIIRSGVTGRKSFGTRPKKLIQKFLENLTDEQLFKANIGNDPSLSDIIKMVRPKPTDKSRAALYAYIIGAKYAFEDLPSLVKDFENFKKNRSLPVPNVPFQMLTSLNLSDDQWKLVAKNATWNQVRMNLNTFNRHNVFSDSKMVDDVFDKLTNENLIKKSKVFPYQLFSAYKATQNINSKLSLGLQLAANKALENIPKFNGKVYVLVDTSGSMSSAITGNRGSATSTMTCVDVAALFASAIMKNNNLAEIIPFDTKVHEHKLNPLDSIVTNANALSKFVGGGTDCSVALAYLNDKKAMGDLVIMISDNESWMDHNKYYRGTSMNNEWTNFKNRNKNAKLVCIDIVPSKTTQVNNEKDVLNIGGFSDNLFLVIEKFISSNSEDDFLTSLIEKWSF